MSLATPVLPPLPPAPADTPAAQRDWKVRGDRRLGWVLVLPLLALLVGLVGYPLGRGLLVSMRISDPTSGVPDRFVGLRNYSDVLSDPQGRSALVHTLAYLGIALVLELVLGLAFALALRHRFFGRTLVFTALVLPWALPGVVAGLLWQRVFSADNGLLNSALFQLHIIGSYHSWLSSPVYAVAFITVVHVWGVLPLTTLVLLSGLNGIPEELYGASAVDGASRLRQFWHVTLPLLRPAIAVALTTGSVSALSIFDEIFVLNGTALSTRSVMMQVYDTTFRQLDFGHGSALAILLSLATAAVGLVWVLIFRRVAV
ncbi:MAG: sugar ABC transporter permease [Actinomycetota bacterium]|nr:sugar ABC transporter permease [Actinomycetota bacterium]